jgi:hypothetical protein
MKEAIMSDRFLEADEALQALIQELERFKSSSEHLRLTRDSVEQLLGSTQALTGKAGELLGRGEQQLDAMATLADGTEQRVQLVVKEQQALAESFRSTLSAVLDRLNAAESKLGAVEARLTKQVEPVLGEVHGLARANRRLLVLVLILTLVSAGLGGYLVWLTIQ